jgi:type IV secretory pathway VirB10-like protein
MSDAHGAAPPPPPSGPQDARYRAFRPDAAVAPSLDVSSLGESPPARTSPRRDLHWWLGGALVVLALPMLVWQSMRAEDGERTAQRAQSAQRDATQVRPPDTTTALERTIREQAEAAIAARAAMTSVDTASAIRGRLPAAQSVAPTATGGTASAIGMRHPSPGASLPAGLTAEAVSEAARRGVRPLPSGFERVTGLHADSGGAVDSAAAARRQQLEAEAERRLADAHGSPVLALGGSASRGSGTGAGAAAGSALNGAGLTQLRASDTALTGLASGQPADARASRGERSASDLQAGGEAVIAQTLERLRSGGLSGESTTSTAVHSDRRWLEQAQAGARPGAPLSVRPSPGQHVILQGTIIPAVLLTEINSELPGPLSAQVTQDVWDSIDSRYLLIPRGSRLVGEYNSDVRPGQERVLAAFSRLIFPSGASVDLLGTPAADAQGRSGLHDQVDRRFWQMFGTSFVIAGLASLVQRRESQPGTVIVVPGGGVGGGSALSSAAGTVLVDTARTALGRQRSLPPVLIVRQGHRFALTVQRDFLVFSENGGTIPSPFR